MTTDAPPPETESLPTRPQLPLPRQVALVAGTVATAALLRLALDPLLQERVPYALFLAATAASARWGGWRTGVAATGLSLGVASYLFAHPRGSLVLAESGDWVAATLFSLAAAIIVVAIHSEQRGRRLLEQRDARLRAGREEQRRLERALQEAQRLEGIGRLAGGVAHDFNNLLTVVLGSVQLLKPRDADVPLVKNIETAARRGADLNKQLLGFARRQMLEVKPMTLNDAVSECVRLAARLLPEDIRLETTLHAEPWTFDGDATQVQQVLLNLVTNARDALPNGGRITLTTDNVTLDEVFARTNPEVTPGEYAHLVVTDDGQGMPAELLDRVFEPFVTTKEVGKGTGLGLAVTYGVVRQLGGHVSLRSRVGEGTRFDIYFPRTRAKVLGGPVATRPRIMARTLRVLLVEDDELVRDAARGMLERLGHRVISAANGAEALQLARPAETSIDLLLTDVVMPWMNGRELSERLREARPNLAVVFISGYTENVVLQKGIVKPGVILLKKPFSLGELADAIERVEEKRAAS